MYKHTVPKAANGVTYGGITTGCTLSAHSSPRFFAAASSMLFITFAGTPPTIIRAGTSFVTTAPAATTASSPMCTPLSMVAWAPIHTPRPMTIGA